MERMKVLITVKTYPIPSAKHDELVCTAARHAIKRQRGELIGRIERQLKTQHSVQPLIMVKWCLR